MEVGGLPEILYVAKEKLVFYAGYLAVSVLLLYVLSRLADRKIDHRETKQSCANRSTVHHECRRLR